MKSNAAFKVTNHVYERKAEMNGSNQFQQRNQYANARARGPVSPSAGGRMPAARSTPVHGGYGSGFCDGFCDAAGKMLKIATLSFSFGKLFR